MIILESTYEVETHTASLNIRYAATNDPVYITLYGSKGSSPEMQLNNTVKFTFDYGK